MLLIRQAWHNRLTWSACAWFVLAATLAHGQELENLKTGRAFTRQLDEQVGITLQGQGLRDVLARVSRAYAIAIFLDRRIDPDQQLTLAVSDQPLQGLLQRIAAEAGAGIATIGAVVYMGPRETASRLATLAAAARRQDVATLTNEAKARLLRAETWHWDELAQPRQLLEGLAEKAGVKVENSDAIPLDLWPAVTLPALPWTDRLTLLLAGFDLTFAIGDGGSSIRLVPQPTMAALTKKAPQDDAKSGRPARAAKLAKGGGDKLYSLRVANEPAGKVIRTVAQSLGKELKYDRRVLESLKQPVTFNLQNASLDFLLTTTLEPLGLAYRLTDDALEIVEKE